MNILLQHALTMEQFRMILYMYTCIVYRYIWIQSVQKTFTMHFGSKAFTVMQFNVKCQLETTAEGISGHCT